MLGCQNRKKPLNFSQAVLHWWRWQACILRQHTACLQGSKSWIPRRVAFHPHQPVWQVYCQSVEPDHSILDKHSLDLPLTPLHFLCTQYMHWEHWIEFKPTPLRQTAQGNAPESGRRSSPGPETMSFVFFMLTLSPLRSIPSFHTFNLAMHSSSESAITARSSA